MAKDKNWISKAIKKPGALRAKAKKAGLVKKGEKLSAKDLSVMEKKAKKSGNLKTERQINLAKTLKGFNKK